MLTFIVVFLVMAITILIMAVGVIFGREPIKGSCGGLNNVGVERACGCKDVCEKQEMDIDESATPNNPSVGFYSPEDSK